MKTALQIIGVILAMAAFVAVIKIALQKEDARLSAVQDHNCRYYGPEINAHTGKETCPPTPHG